jgi:hypothetical protein
MVEFIAAETFAPKTKKAMWNFAPKTDLRDHIKVTHTQSTIAGETFDFAAELITSDSFNAAFYARQQFEVAAGREEEPLLYQLIYTEIDNPDLPKNVTIYQVKEGGFVFEKIVEGGEVKFASVVSGSLAIPIEHFAVGIQYSKDFFIFNETWNLSVAERSAGRAHNALLNHIHFWPIINFSYASKNLTATYTGKFYKDASLAEKYLRAIEMAITASQEDETDRRNGPYVLMVSPSDRFLVERALTVVAQQGTSQQSSAVGDIRTVLAYNGWTGTRGKKTTTYGGVPAGTAFLVSVGLAREDFVSLVKQGLVRTDGNPDVSRFILNQSVWDTYRGVYAAPAAAVQKITWPTISSGDAPPVAA